MDNQQALKASIEYELASLRGRVAWISARLDSGKPVGQLVLDTDRVNKLIGAYEALKGKVD